MEGAKLAASVKGFHALRLQPLEPEKKTQIASTKDQTNSNERNSNERNSNVQNHQNRADVVFYLCLSVDKDFFISLEPAKPIRAGQ